MQGVQIRVYTLSASGRPTFSAKETEAEARLYSSTPVYDYDNSMFDSIDTKLLATECRNEKRELKANARNKGVFSRSADSPRNHAVSMTGEVMKEGSGKQR